MQTEYGKIICMAEINKQLSTRRDTIQMPTVFRMKNYEPRFAETEMEVDAPSTFDYMKYLPRFSECESLCEAPSMFGYIDANTEISMIKKKKKIPQKKIVKRPIWALKIQDVAERSTDK